MTERIWKPHVTVATVVKEDARYLCVEERIRGQVVVNQPAGHLEPDETLIQAARRETREETAYSVTIEHLLGLFQWKSPRGKEFIRAVFAGTVVDHHPEATLDDGILRAVWLSRDELSNGRNLRSPMVLRSIDAFESGHRFPLEVIRNVNL